jgi:GT2 family glycosyltransferase
MISVAIPSWNGRRHLERLLPSLLCQPDPGEPWEILIHENGSSDGTSEWLRESYPRIRVLESSRNAGFAQPCNELVEASNGDLVILLNNDTLPSPGWLQAFVSAARGAPSEVAALSGKMISWDETRLDFEGGVMTFDGHAFQVDQGARLSNLEGRASGSMLPFACGGNMIVRRQIFLKLGGFERDFFAYFEDVDLGWRLWSAGYQVLYCPEASVRHRGGATTVLHGLFKRGFLFERNSMLTVMRNYDPELWPKMMAPILLTFQSRLQAMMKFGNPGSSLLLEDPYQEPDGFLELARKKGGKQALVTVIQRVLGLEKRGILVDRLSIAQLQAQASFLRLLDETMDQRDRIQSRRVVPDREIFERFPPHIVPTYPGDSEFFASSGFKALLPNDIPFVVRGLEEMLTIS